MDVFSTNDYRDILRRELARRIKQNPRYSQGAFARDLHLTPGRLSEILHGKQGLSVKAASDIAQFLRFKNDEEKSYFLDLIVAAHGRSRLLRENAGLRLRRYQTLPHIARMGEDIFRSISDWHHMAILEMAQMPGQPREASGIAKVLGISENEAKEALDRLQRLDLLTAEGGPKSPGQSFEGSLYSESFQNFTRQILSKAIEALGKRGLQSTRSFMIALSQKRLSELIQLIDQKSEQLAELVFSADAKDSEKDALYCLSLQFFPLLQTPK